jgi:hypothetical protein
MSAILFEFLPFALIALAAIGAMLLCNNLIRARLRTRQPWSGIDVQLKPEPVVIFAADVTATPDVKVPVRTA